MSKSEFYLKMEDALESSPGTVEGSQVLADLEGWDSTAVISFIAMIDSEYGVSLPAKEIAACRTVDDLFELVKRSRGV
jgi:acyl carrier protein